MVKKQVIKVNETQLKSIIAKSVKTVLNEHNGFSDNNTLHYTTFDKWFARKKKTKPNWFESITFHPFKIENVSNFMDEIHEVNPQADVFVDDENGDINLHILGGKIVGEMCRGMFGSDDRKLLPFLWTTNHGKTAHAVSSNGNIVSQEYIGYWDTDGDYTVLLGSDNKIYFSWWCGSSNYALFYIKSALCKENKLFPFRIGSIFLYKIDDDTIGWYNPEADKNENHGTFNRHKVLIDKYGDIYDNKFRRIF